MLGAQVTPIAESDTDTAVTPVGVPGAPVVMFTPTAAEAFETWPRVSTEATVSMLGAPAGTATSAAVAFTWR